jgi:hypothetical protein
MGNMNYGWKKNAALLSFFVFLIIASTNTTAQFCTGSFGSPIVNITFGAGANNPGNQLSVIVPGATTSYSFEPNATGFPPANVIFDGSYSIVNGVPSNGAWFQGSGDHTGNLNGYMAFFNSAETPGEFYKQTVTGLCGGTTYEFAAWVANVVNTVFLLGGIPPNITFKILDPSNQQILNTINSGDIQNGTSMKWNQYSLLFTTPTNINSVILVLSNNNIGGNARPGNDLAIDDITFRACGPSTKASFSNSNLVDSITINSCTNIDLFGSIAGNFNAPSYQWQISTDNGVTFSNINNANTLNFTVPVLTAGNYQLQLLSAEAGNISSSNCRFISNKLKLIINSCTPLTTPCNNWLRIPNSQSYATVGDIDVIGSQIKVEGMFSRDSAFTDLGFTSLNVVSKHWTPADVNYLLRVDRAQITTTNGHFVTPDRRNHQ